MKKYIYLNFIFSMLLLTSSIAQVVNPNNTNSTPTKSGVSRKGERARYAIASLPTCNSGSVDVTVNVSDGNKGYRTCRETSSSVYRWIDDDPVYRPERFYPDAVTPASTTTAIQLAIDAAFAAGGGIVKLGDKEYIYNGQLEMKGDVVLEGGTKGGTVLTHTGSSGWAINLEGTSPARVTGGLKDLQLNGASATGTAGGVKFGWNQRSPHLIKNVQIREFPSWGIYANNENWIVGMQTVELTSNGRLVSNTGGFGFNPAIANFLQFTMTGAIIESNGTASSAAGGIHIAPTAPFAVQGFTCRSCTIEDNAGTDEVYIKNSVNVLFDETYFETSADRVAVELDNSFGGFTNCQFHAFATSVQPQVWVKNNQGTVISDGVVNFKNNSFNGNNTDGTVKLSNAQVFFSGNSLLQVNYDGASTWESTQVVLDKNNKDITRNSLSLSPKIGTNSAIQSQLKLFADERVSNPNRYNYITTYNGSGGSGDTELRFGLSVAGAAPVDKFFVKGGFFSNFSGASYPIDISGGIRANEGLINKIRTGTNADLSLPFQLTASTSGYVGAFRYLGGTNNPGVYWTVDETNSRAGFVGTGSSGSLGLILGGGNTQTFIVESNNLSPIVANSASIGKASSPVSEIFTKKVTYSSGANASIGTVTLVAGTATVTTTATPNNGVTGIIELFQSGASTGAVRVSASTTGTSFTITSDNAASVNVVAWKFTGIN